MYNSSLIFGKWTRGSCGNPIPSQNILAAPGLKRICISY